AVDGRRRRRLAVADLRRADHGRPAARLHRRDRRVPRPHVRAGEGPAAVRAAARAGRRNARVKSRRWVLVAVVWIVATQWSMVAWEPLFSESYTELELVGAFDSPWRAFDPQLVPFRPLQHLTFWLLQHGCDGSPAVGRALSHGM